VAVLTTGDEVVRPSQTPGPGQVRDANGPWLAARLHELGAEVLPAAGAGDDPDLLATALSDAAAGADLVVTTGGASVGRHDRTTEVLEALGEGRSLTLPLRPGRPCVLGRVGSTPVLGLPGTPLAALVVFELVGTPAVRALAGRHDTDPPVVSAPLRGPVDTRADGRTTVVPAFVDDAGVRLAVHRGSSQLVGAAGADGLALLDGPADAGTHVPVVLLRP
jgi:molybdopterin molybdotransferase